MNKRREGIEMTNTYTWDDDFRVYVTYKGKYVKRVPEAHDAIGDRIAKAAYRAITAIQCDPTRGDRYLELVKRYTEGSLIKYKGDTYLIYEHREVGFTSGWAGRQTTKISGVFVTMRIITPEEDSANGAKWGLSYTKQHGAFVLGPPPKKRRRRKAA